MGSGILPIPKKFISQFSDFKLLSPALPFDFLARSITVWRTILSRRAADPFGETLCIV